MLSSKIVPDDNSVSSATALSVNVLILDDSEFDRKRIRRLFRAAGLSMFLDEVDTIKGLQSALDEARYDVVIIDYNLSEGTGIDAVNLVQNHPENSTARAIMITGDDQSEVAVQALKMGCEDYISKARLTADRLKQAVVSSIVARAGMADENSRVDQLVQDMARDVLTEMSGVLQPKLAYMLRDLRSLKRQLMHPETNVPGRLDVIDKTCVEMWKALAEAPALCTTDPTDLKLH